MLSHSSSVGGWHLSKESLHVKLDKRLVARLATDSIIAVLTRRIDLPDSNVRVP
jgi:uncharacterized protein YggU (UPF0235/DUF167 family)